MLRMCRDCASYRTPKPYEGLPRCGRFVWWNGPTMEYAPCRVARDATGECGIEARHFQAPKMVAPATDKPLPWWRRLFSRRER